MYTVPSIDGHWSHVSIFLLKKVITNRMLMLDMQFPFLPVGVNWMVVKDVHFATPLIDTGLMSIFLLTKVIATRMLILDVQFPFLTVGVKWKVVKNVHCPSLLIDTSLMSIGPLTKKLLQKHRPVSYSKKRRKRALSPRSLTESSAESELSRLDAH